MSEGIEQTTCDGACTVTLVVDSAPITPEKAADLEVIFWGFVLVAAIVWGIKRIINIFSADSE